MKIAFFYYLGLEYGGGTAKYFTEVSAGFKKRFPSSDVTILSLDKSFINRIIFIYKVFFRRRKDEALKENLKDLRIKLGEVRYCKPESLRDLRQRLENFDYIYTSNDFLQVLFLRFLGKKLPKKTILGFHSSIEYPSTIKSFQAKFHNYLYSSVIYKFLVKNMYKIHVLNSFDEKIIKKKFPSKTVVKINIPFDFSSFNNESKKTKLNFNWNTDKINILWVGRLCEQKGVDDLILVIDRINITKYKNKIVWNIVGDGELINKILDLKNKWSNLNYFGYINSKYMANIYDNNDLFVSTSKWESFPYNLLEAQSFGMPAISYNIRGCDEIITNNINGYLVNNPKELEKGVLDFLKYNPFDRKKIKNFISKRFNKESIYNNLYELFANIDK